MARFAFTAVASLVCGLALAGATSAPPTDSSHVTKQPATAAPKPAEKPKPVEKPKPAAKPKPAVKPAKPAVAKETSKPMSAWRRAYIARTGHEPPAPGKAATHAAAARKVPPLKLKKRCD